MQTRGAIHLAAAMLAAALAIGCGADDDRDLPRAPREAPPETEPEGLAVTPRALPSVGAGGTITLRGGGEIHTVVIAGRVFVPIEATFSEASWRSVIGHAAITEPTKAARAEYVKTEIGNVLGVVRTHLPVLGVQITPSVGLVTAYVPLDAWSSLSTIHGVGHRVLVAPTVMTPLERAERDLDRDRARGIGAFWGLGGLGGIGRLGVPELIDAVKADLGSAPDGSHVTLGVVDTGITYAHPAFEDALGESRIDAMKDFTGEGRIVFAPNASIAVAPAAKVPLGAKADEALDITTDYLLAPVAAYESPDPSALTHLAGHTILVGAELHAALTAPDASGARFGVLSEKAFASKSRGVDLDHDGKTDGVFDAILIPGGAGGSDTLWLALGTRGDFRRSVPLTSFEVAHAWQQAYSERIAFEIKHETLLDGSGNDVAVTTAALVGFDPGNHGSHVAGIAAARKLIANAPDDTELRGVAPLARIVSGRICANTGGCRGTKAIVDLSDAGADVINMSIGSLDEDNDGYGVQEAIIDRLTMQNGTVFVIAASNDGPGRQTVGSPSVARLGISVGATASPAIIGDQYHWPGTGKVASSDPTATDFMMYFSSRGPTAAGGMKPDLTAPGAWLSAIQLNAAPGAASGLDVMWGTSMASPAAAGAVALLLDAARRWNIARPGDPLATDARTLRRVLLASARPFDTTTLDTKTGETTNGQYTLVDEGHGMLSLPRAWALLKSERSSRVPSGVTTIAAPGDPAREVPLDWQIRVLRTNPNGLAYDGTRSIQGAGGAAEPRLGRGVWIDANADDTLFKVQIARRLPADAAAREDVGDLALQLKTTADELELETIIHGSHIPWVRAGGMSIAGCASGAMPPPPAALPRIAVIGEGAIDVPVDPKTGAGGSVAQSSSVMFVCVDRGLAAALPPGDHGAIIKAYRVSGTTREATPAFVVPVTMTVPHRTLASQTGFHIDGTVESFGVARHYVDVPKGTSLVKVTMTVPPAGASGGVVTSCSGVSLEALEAGNTFIPPEHVANPSSAIAQSCTSAGKVAPESWTKSTYTRTAPRSGLWDLHVFGLYSFASSSYALDVAFAKVASSVPAIEGAPPALDGTFDVDVLDASYPLVVSESLSRLTLAELSQKTTANVAEGAKLRAPRADGVVGRTYDADVARVTIATSDSAGNDLDLAILECDDATLAVCKKAASSAGPSDVESASFTPKAGKVYVAEVEGYAIVAGGGAFTLRETLRVKSPETGTLAMTQPTPSKFVFTTTFPYATSPLLADARFMSAAYTVEGEVAVKDDEGTTILRVPVRIVH